jgi:hypothetical protein
VEVGQDLIPRKREAYREAFDGFDPERISRYGQRELAALLEAPASSATAPRSRQPCRTRGRS